MKISYEDTYFLDRDLAYQTALAHNTVELENGQKQEQVCYYDGAPFQHAPKNLINVPVELFADYFSTHSKRIPKRIDTNTSPISSGSEILKTRIQGMMSLLENIRNRTHSG